MSVRPSSSFCSLKLLKLVFIDMMSSCTLMLFFETCLGLRSFLSSYHHDWSGWEIFLGNYSMMQNLVIYIDCNMVPGFEIFVRIHSASVVNVMIQDSWEWLQFGQLLPIYTQGSNQHNIVHQRRLAEKSHEFLPFHHICSVMCCQNV